VSVTSDAEGRFPTGGELTLFEAVGQICGLTFVLLCRSSPIGDVWRDLIDAWHRVLSDEVCGVGMTDAALGAGKAIRDQAQDQIQREILVRVCP
jgi:hypothetical protein